MIINKTLLVQYSPLPRNYNLDEVMIYQDISIDIWVKPLLGEELVDEIEQQVEDNELSDNNQALLTTGGLLQYLAYAICYQALPFIYARFTETGIVVNDSDHTKSVDLKQLNYITDSIRRTLETLKDKLKDWLCTRQDYYPLFNPCACGCDSCQPNDTLNSPQPLFGLYSLPPKCTDIR